MFARTLSFRLIFATIVSIAGARAADAELTSRSPFMPPQAAASNTPAQNAPLEFGGYMDSPSDGRLYRITVKEKDPARTAILAGAAVAVIAFLASMVAVLNMRAPVP